MRTDFDKDGGVRLPECVDACGELHGFARMSAPVARVRAGAWCKHASGEIRDQCDAWRTMADRRRGLLELTEHRLQQVGMKCVGNIQQLALDAARSHCI